jgi:RNA polymerase sigma-70 factor (ECF subfamily)
MPHHLLHENFPGVSQDIHSLVHSEDSPDKALEKFLGQQFGPLVGFLRNRDVTEPDAQDVAQESLIRLMRYRDQPVEVLKVLLYRIALNLLSDNRRRFAANHGVLHFSLDAELHELPSDEPNHEQRVDQQQELMRVRDAIFRLPERSRQIYLLNRIDGMSYSQISKHCQISVKSVEKHISKALSSLRIQLKTDSRHSDHTRTP